MRQFVCIVLFFLSAGIASAQTKNFTYYKSLGMVEYYEKNFLEAIFNLQKANALKPSDREVAETLRMSYDSVGSKDLAGKMRMKMEKFTGKGPEKRPFIAPAEITDESTISGAPKSKNGQVILRPKTSTALDMSDIKALGDYFMDRESYDSALICYKQYLRSVPGDTGVLYYLAACQYFVKDYDAAIENYNIVLKHDPTRADIYNWIGVCDYLRGSYLIARDNFKQCIRYDKDYGLAYFNLAKTQYELEDYGSAAKNLEKAQELIPNDLDVVRLLADIYYNAGKWDTAQKLYERVYDTNKRSEKYNYRLGDICGHLGKWDKSILYFETYFQVVKENADARKKLGIAYYHTEKFTFAIDNFERATKTLWDDKELMLYTAIAANKLGNYSKGLEYAKRALTLDKDYARAYYQLGVALRGEGEKRQAREAFQKANDLGVNGMNP
jgi:tetratricopeptide (TPR) repeat protein